MSTLFVTATPIGNLADTTPRMLDTLRSVSLIAAEDTRVTGNLLRHFGIRTQLTSLHRHNEAGKAPSIIARMREEGIDVALTTDAGTPAISDPGHLLVEAAWESGFTVLPVVGPTAIAAAISVSGFDARAFAFYGFLPRESGALRKKLRAIAGGPSVAVVYESPHRILSLMEAAEEVLPGGRACVCCDLTKLYERSVRGDIHSVLEVLRTNPKVDKGEYCVVLDMPRAVEAEETAPAVGLAGQLFDLLMQGMDIRAGTGQLMARGARKNEIKRAAIAMEQFMQRYVEKD